MLYANVVWSWSWTTSYACALVSLVHDKLHYCYWREAFEFRHHVNLRRSERERKTGTANENNKNVFETIKKLFLKHEIGLSLSIPIGVSPFFFSFIRTSDRSFRFVEHTISLVVFTYLTKRQQQNWIFRRKTKHSTEVYWPENISIFEFDIPNREYLVSINWKSILSSKDQLFYVENDTYPASSNSIFQ